LFFFQAEDGIRDFHVTGVQTCALPISARSNFHADRDVPMTRAPTIRASWSAASPTPLPTAWIRTTSPARSRRSVKSASCAVRKRSEERRVGKEGSGRWWPWQEKEERGT